VVDHTPSDDRLGTEPAPLDGIRLRLPGRFHAAVFDMDGLLVDSEPLWVLAEAELLERHGDRLTAEDVEATHGRSIDDTIVAYAVRLGGIDPDGLRAELMSIMRAHYGTSPPIRPGARELVRLLAGRIPLAVASNTDVDLVRLALAGAGLLDAFTAVVSGADMARAKPHPAVYLEACRQLGVAPRDAVAFEDSPAGVQAAKAAGLTCVAVPDREGVDLGAAGADLVIGSLAELVGEAPV
jgi:HAD superfamily hydrolase (TIGR01509 family)